MSGDRHRRVQLVTRSAANLGEMGVGLSAFARPGHRWLFHVVQPRRVSAGQLRQDRIDAVVVGGKSPKLARELRQWGGLVVSTSAAMPGQACARHDNRAAGRLAAGHLLERGLRHFGFVSDAGTVFTEERLAGFSGALAEAGFDCRTCRIDRMPRAKRRHSTAGEKVVADWLKAGPCPVGLLAAKAEVGVQVAQAAWGAGVRVPEEAAVVCCGGPPGLCELAHTPLSAVLFNGRRLGQEVGRLLAGLFAGEVPPAEDVLVPPRGLTERQSSDVYAVDDPEVVAALVFIRVNAHRPIGVADIAAATSVSRRVLERRFARHLERSPHEQLCRVRVTTACRLLAETALPIEEVAVRCGFANNSRLVEQFTRRMGCTPSAYRRRRQP
jgi:LacI family transcriptional regulator